MLGYGVDPHSPVLLDMTAQLIDGRDNRNPQIVAKLNELGVSITMDEVEAEAGGAVVGRPHVAAVLSARGTSPRSSRPSTSTSAPAASPTSTRNG